MLFAGAFEREIFSAGVLVGVETVVVNKAPIVAVALKLVTDPAPEGEPKHHVDPVQQRYCKLPGAEEGKFWPYMFSVPEIARFVRSTVEGSERVQVPVEVIVQVPPTAT